MSATAVDDEDYLRALQHDPRGAQPPSESSRLTDGASFVLDRPTSVPAVWGDSDDVLWAEGESLVIAGPPGVGKTTLSSQVLRGRLGLQGSVLGLPVRRTSTRVLLLAMDRPQQIARALGRTFLDTDRDTLTERLQVWPGPPPADVARYPTTLLDLARKAGADTVVVDSMKDAAIGLVDDETGAAYNRARQTALAAGVELLELHHMVKRGANGTRPTTLADVYGSMHLTAGAGSVLLLWGSAGDPIVELVHLKQPAAEVGPHRLIHDHLRGTTDIWSGTDLVQLTQLAGRDGLTAKAAATAMFGDDKPTPAQVEKARRRLETLTRQGLVEVLHGGDKTTSTPAAWTFTQTITAHHGQEAFTT